MRMLIAVLLLMPSVVLAGSITVRWANPVQYTDGSPIRAGELVNTTVELGTCSAPGVFGSVTKTHIAGAPGSIWKFTNLKNGRTFCVRARSRTSSDVSNWSDVISRVARK